MDIIFCIEKNVYAHHNFRFLSIGFILTGKQQKALYTETLRTTKTSTSTNYNNNKRQLLQQQTTIITITHNNYYNNKQQQLLQ